jgi:hypothetical protein
VHLVGPIIVILNPDRRQLLGGIEFSGSDAVLDVRCSRLVGSCGHFGRRCCFSLQDLVGVLHPEERGSTPDRIISHCSLHSPTKKNFLGALVFRPVPGVIWAADSENYIG